MGFMPTIVEPFAFQPDRWVSHIQDFSGGGSSTDSDALLWKAAVVAAGGTVSDPRLALVSTLIGSLKTNGVWTLLDRLWLLAAENSQSALIDLVARASATAVNTPTLTADQGYAGNGTTSFVNSNFQPATNAVHLTTSNVHMGAYSRTDNGGNTFKGIGVFNQSSNGPGITIHPRANGAVNFQLSDTGWTSKTGWTVATGAGYTLINRFDATNTNVMVSKNGVDLTGTYNAVDGVLDNNALYIAGGSNNGGVLNNANTDQWAAVHLGASLSSGQRSAVASAINTYLTNLPVPANVY